ncbi:response regulator transcription factor [Kribbella turkmenica]|uniref:Response regulator transcription factor n=1 Tax=Kribbella turkmenica TaxID=2530375 RepID=A0A4R4WQT5_9ACTN|nr:LuxR C-terminal-related transcriptional regulator [Kribbella turkmenica]TDD20234.1 response regulator transcription factor [Kribbella turkmenica]
MNGHLTVTTLNRPHGFHQIPAHRGIAELLATAEDEVIAMSNLAPAGPGFGPREVRPGLRYRALYPDTARTAPTAGRHLGAMSLAGVAVRTVPYVPMNALVIDGSVAVLPADTANGSVAVLRLTGVVTTAVELFERIWPDAVPLSVDELPDDTELSVREQELLRLLALGSTDEVAADQLGISVRTVRRMVAQIMHRLGARSRFQAGVKAADRGWLRVRAADGPGAATA